MNISRKWAMPNRNTFTIKPIKALITKYLMRGGLWVDPFVRNSIFKPNMTFTNDLNPNFTATSHVDALLFMKGIKTGTVDGVLFDPPYSPRQVKECYDGIGQKLTQEDTQSSFWGNLKKEIARVLKPGGIVITCCWNSGGCGKSNGLEHIEVLLVAHGGWHNDTIVVVEKKRNSAAADDDLDDYNNGGDSDGEEEKWQMLASVQRVSELN